MKFLIQKTVHVGAEFLSHLFKGMDSNPTADRDVKINPTIEFLIFSI